MRRLVCGFVGLLLIALPLQQSAGWGQKGHRIVGAVAWNHLNETTKRSIQQLIQNKRLSAVANWADSIKTHRPETRPWHYVDIPLGATGYDASRDCMGEHQEFDCVVAKIEEFAQVLGDRTADPEERKEALMFVVHFVGDIHQPFHAVGDARGGNEISVTLFGQERCTRSGCNLHAVWDDGLIQHAGLAQAAYVNHLEQLICDEGLSASGSAEDWANESHDLGKAPAWVADGTNINQAYYDAQIKVVDRRLALGGLRLAALLNQTLGQTAPVHFRHHTRE